MPGWHASTKGFVEDGRLLNVGILQEQHPDRARLYLQWQQIDWPILVDSLNRLDVNVVPITLLIDENGVIRKKVGPRDDARVAVEAFLAEPAPEPVPAAKRPERHPAIFAKATELSKMIAGYENVLSMTYGQISDNGRSLFELGVLYRRRYDEGGGNPADFAQAVARWGQAIAADPNQYIWRRRIQQYGPRLEKPYPFYDWVDTARAEIEARGETAPALIVEPVGAEIARPIRSFDAALPADGEPDPDGKITRDNGDYVHAHATVVPTSVEPGKTARVHLEFRPGGRDSHWNNEAGGTTLWLHAPDGLKLDRKRIERPNPAAPVSDEPRRLEFEVQVPEDAEGTIRLPGYALYYVCEGLKGACLYRRQDLHVAIPVAAAP